MCLSSVSKEIEKKYKDKRFGWKLFSCYGKILVGAVMNEYLDQHFKGYPYETWLNERKYRENPNENYIRDDNDVIYRTGWHIFLTREDAQSYRNTGEIVRKVEFKNPVAYGWQDELKVVVAKDMKIIIPVKRGK